MNPLEDLVVGSNDDGDTVTAENLLLGLVCVGVHDRNCRAWNWKSTKTFLGCCST